MEPDHQVLLVFSLLVLAIVITILVLVIFLRKDVKKCGGGGGGGGKTKTLQKANANDIKQGKKFILGLESGQNVYLLSPTSSSFVDQVPKNQFNLAFVQEPANADLHLQLTRTGNLQASNGDVLQATSPTPTPTPIPSFGSGNGVAITPKTAFGGKVSLSFKEGTTTYYLDVSSTGLNVSTKAVNLDAYLV